MRRYIPFLLFLPVLVVIGLSKQDAIVNTVKNASPLATQDDWTFEPIDTQEEIDSTQKVLVERRRADEQVRLAKAQDILVNDGFIKNTTFRLVTNKPLYTFLQSDDPAYFTFSSMRWVRQCSSLKEALVIYRKEGDDFVRVADDMCAEVKTPNTVWHLANEISWYFQKQKQIEKENTERENARKVLGE